MGMTTSHFDDIAASFSMGMQPSQLDGLDKIAERITAGGDASIGYLSIGERLYVAIAANRPDLMSDYTLVQAIARLDDADLQALITRWQYRG